MFDKGLSLSCHPVREDPEAYRTEQINKKLPDDFEDLAEAEQQRILSDLEGVVASVDPIALTREIHQLNQLIDQALILENREIESKLVKLKEVITHEGIFQDPKMKMLIFTEHKDTLDCLVSKLRGWGLSVTQIHGGMKIGDRDTPNTRIYSEREFREDCQVLVATEAAGEGINLQFCWFMINYDIPWNPVRLEQRMGRIHRYGQDKDCLILNFVSINTTEGKVFWKLFERIRAIEIDLDPERTGKVFNVLGDIFPANQLERMMREMYAHNLTEAVILDRIVEQVDTERFRRISDSALEGLAKRELNLSQIIGKSAEAKERRLIPEVIDDFFVQAAPIAGIHPKETANGSKVYRIGRIPRTLWGTGDRLENRFGKLGREYKKITFNKNTLTDDPTLEWVTPGHPLFECVRDEVHKQVEADLRRGAVFFDFHQLLPARLDVFSAAIADGRGRKLHERLYVVQTDLDGKMSTRQPTLFLDLVPASLGFNVLPDDTSLPSREQVEQALIEQELNSFLAEIRTQRQREVKTISTHLEISLNTIIDKVQIQYADLFQLRESGSKEAGLDGRIKQLEDRLFELNGRLEQRREELQQEASCAITEIHHHGRAWVLPHPERSSPEMASMVCNQEIEEIAIKTVIAYEQARGWEVVSVERENRGFDLISRQLDSGEVFTASAVRFIEVKGRAGVGEVALTTNEYKTAYRLKGDYWLYVVFNCATTPTVHTIQDPIKLNWQPLVKIEHYHVSPEQIIGARLGI